MPSKNKFDDILKNKFDGFEAPLPKGGFDAIKNDIPKERKRRGFLIPLLAAASLFFASLSGYLLFKLNKLSSDKNNFNKEVSVVGKNLDTQQSEESKYNESKSEDASQSFQNSNVSANGNTINDDEVITSLDENLASIDNDVTTGNDNAITQNDLNSVTSNDLLATAIVSTVDENVRENLNVINQNISPALFRNIALSESDVLSRNLIGAVEVMVISDFIEEEEEKQEERNSKWHIGVSAGPNYTLKSVAANLNDDELVTSFEGDNTVTRRKTGFNTGILIGYDLSKRLQVYSKLDVTNLRDENIFEVAQTLNAPTLVSTDGNNMTLTTAQIDNVRLNSSYMLAGLNGGLKYKIGNATYVNIGSGVHYLISEKEEGGTSNDNSSGNLINFSSSFALGKQYKLGNAVSLNVEPEIKGFYKSLQSDGLIQATPYALGINFILLY